MSPQAYIPNYVWRKNEVEDPKGAIHRGYDRAIAFLNYLNREEFQDHPEHRTDFGCARVKNLTFDVLSQEIRIRDLTEQRVIPLPRIKTPAEIIAQLRAFGLEVQLPRPDMSRDMYEEETPKTGAHPSSKSGLTSLVQKAKEKIQITFPSKERKELKRITRKKKDLAGFASPREDGWFFSDFSLLCHLFRGLGSNQL